MKQFLDDVVCNEKKSIFQGQTKNQSRKLDMAEVQLS